MLNRFPGNFFLIILLIISLTGCRSGKYSEVTLADDFESGQLAGFWLPGDYGSGRYVPEAVSFTGKTSYEKGKNRFYHKIGLYRDQWPDPMIIYFDDYILTNDTVMIWFNYGNIPTSTLFM